ncbi:RNA methyltransferase [Devosia algicola]|uniref:RNA methyltransferase n=1 Tax=Devosia algicola TaxID=3026418 RepID=A0ABY7YKR0_9HYPH|nr:RNA methyltransferase [Devosia algicola]WDR01753.1 RNA methyltransferase [Devosia algicola]
MSTIVTIQSLGQRAEGVAEIDGKRIFVPRALPGERVEIEHDGDRADLLAIENASPARIAPFCPHFEQCGGCQTQHMDTGSYQAFKSSLIETPLQFAGIQTPVSRFVDAGGDGRRRATLHARREGSGYMRARSHQVEPIEHCPILVPALARAPAMTSAVYQAIGEADVSFTATLTGLDVAVRTGKKRANAKALEPLVARFRLARLTLNGEMVLQTQPPAVRMGLATVELPSGSFLQATKAAENFLAEYVIEALKGAKNAADLFCGVGPFAFRLAQSSKVFAADSDDAAIKALDQARRLTRGLKQLTAQRRDLFREEMTRFELVDFDAVVLDPPRAGAANQVRELAASKVKTIVMIACDPKTFARDAATLIGGGYKLDNLVAVDQFVHSTHIEIAATFRR